MGVQGPQYTYQGETWNILKIGFQLKQVRVRLAKALINKDVLRMEKRNFLLFDIAKQAAAGGSPLPSALDAAPSGRSASLVRPGQAAERAAVVHAVLRQKAKDEVHNSSDQAQLCVSTATDAIHGGKITQGLVRPPATLISSSSQRNENLCAEITDPLAPPSSWRILLPAYVTSSTPLRDCTALLVQQGIVPSRNTMLQQTRVWTSAPPRSELSPLSRSTSIIGAKHVLAMVLHPHRHDRKVHWHPRYHPIPQPWASMRETGAGVQLRSHRTLAVPAMAASAAYGTHRVLDSNRRTSWKRNRAPPAQEMGLAAAHHGGHAENAQLIQD
ncbi:hypothetical protein MVEN_00722800 [Mycena venus]|uniref:Uncharacterized protein n=1 Tax=Mycena venus TaxID=2733690 RepID=A0A8H6YKI5_9AGAR|nr:hypothetical protein MVEN_00722800 [Mycena venus]